jgi:hypothetical protein
LCKNIASELALIQRSCMTTCKILHPNSGAAAHLVKSALHVKNAIKT